MNLQKKFVTLTIALLFLVAMHYPILTMNISMASSSTTYPWSTFLHDNQRTGFSNSPMPNEIDFLWKTQIEGVHASPVIMNGRVIVATKKGSVYALDQETGKIIWRTNLPDKPKIVSPPTIYNEKIYVTGYEIISLFGQEDRYGYLYVLKEEDGTILRRIQTYGEIRSSPLAADGKVYIGTEIDNDGYGGYLFCFDTNTGNRIWATRLGDIYYSFAMYKNNIYVIASGRLYSINKDTGITVWNCSFAVEGYPIISNGKIITKLTHYGYPRALDCDTGNLLWASEEQVETFEPVVAYGKIYDTTHMGMTGYALAIDESTGKKVWNTSFKIAEDPRLYVSSCSMAVADKKLFVSFYGEICEINVDDGSKIWGYPSSGEAFTALAVADSKIYAVTFRDEDTGCVYAFGSNPLRTSMELSIIDKEKWYNNLNVPFNIDEAAQYVKDAQDNGKPDEKNFGVAPMNLIMKNVGGKTAENVVVTTTVSGHIILIKFDENDKIEDLVFPKDLKIPFYSFEPYSAMETIGTVDPTNPKPVLLNIPIKYMSVLVGKIPYKTNENIDMSLDVLITIVQLDVNMKITGDNFEPTESSTKIYGVGDPARLLEKWNEKLIERIKHLQKKAMEELLQKQVTMCTWGADTKIYSDIGIGTYRFSQIVKIPETHTLIVSAALPASAILTKLLVTLGQTAVISTNVINGFGMIVIRDLDKLLPKGVVMAQIELQTESKTTSVSIVGVSQQTSGTTLAITNVLEPMFFNFTLGFDTYTIAIASNATIDSFELDENGFIQMNVTEIPDNSSIYKLTIPYEVIAGEFKVLINKNQINFELGQNETHSVISFTYTCSQKNYHIEIIPEFSPLILLLLLVALTLIAVIMKKTKPFH